MRVSEIVELRRWLKFAEKSGQHRSVDCESNLDDGFEVTLGGTTLYGANGKIAEITGQSSVISIPD